MVQTGGILRYLSTHTLTLAVVVVLQRAARRVTEVQEQSPVLQVAPETPLLIQSRLQCRAEAAAETEVNVQIPYLRRQLPEAAEVEVTVLRQAQCTQGAQAVQGMSGSSISTRR